MDSLGPLTQRQRDALGKLLRMPDARGSGRCSSLSGGGLRWWYVSAFNLDGEYSEGFFFRAVDAAEFGELLVPWCVGVDVGGAFGAACEADVMPGSRVLRRG